MKDDTKLVHMGRGPSSFEGTVNLPVYRASTILSPDIDSYIHRFDDEKNFTDITYGARGTQNARALGEAVAALESGYGSIVTTSGLSATCFEPRTFSIWATRRRLAYGSTRFTHL